jgi:imidazolonepropionase
MPFAMTLGCRFYGMRPIEALVASTVNPACVLDLDGEVGRLTEGMRGDAVILDVTSFDEIAYRPDADPVVAVICEGQLVHLRPGADHRLKDSR